MAVRRGNQVRVTGGSLRGHGVAVPPRVRPTEGRVREALFSIWQPYLAEARVLDLFAGSGVVALEAASRGALWVLTVESDPRVLRILERNCHLLARGLVEPRRLELPAGLATLARERGASFDLIFADPPYRFTAFQELLLGVLPLMAPDAELVLEHSSRVHPPEEVDLLVRTDRRRYGETSLTFYRLVLEAEGRLS